MLAQAFWEDCSGSCTTWDGDQTKSSQTNPTAMLSYFEIEEFHLQGNVVTFLTASLMVYKAPNGFIFAMLRVNLTIKPRCHFKGNYFYSYMDITVTNITHEKFPRFCRQANATNCSVIYQKETFWLPTTSDSS